MKIGSGKSIFFNKGRDIQCKHCGKELKQSDEDKKKGKTPPLVIGKNGANYCVDCGYKLHIIDGVVYHS